MLNERIQVPKGTLFFGRHDAVQDNERNIKEENYPDDFQHEAPLTILWNRFYA